VDTRSDRVVPLGEGWHLQNKGAVGSGPAVWRPGYGLTGMGAWLPDFRDPASLGCLLALYGPATPDAAMVGLSCSPALLTRIEVTPRVHHIPPPGIEPSSPNQVPHAIWMLGGPWVVSSPPYKMGAWLGRATTHRRFMISFSTPT